MAQDFKLEILMQVLFTWVQVDYRRNKDMVKDSNINSSRKLLFLPSELNERRRKGLTMAREL